MLHENYTSVLQLEDMNNYRGLILDEIEMRKNKLIL
jgi:hypothetical protein